MRGQIASKTTTRLDDHDAVMSTFLSVGMIVREKQEGQIRQGTQGGSIAPGRRAAHSRHSRLFASGRPALRIEGLRGPATQKL